MITTTSKKINMDKLKIELQKAGFVDVFIRFDSTTNLYNVGTSPLDGDPTPIINAHVYTPPIDWGLEYSQAVTLDQKAYVLAKRSGILQLTAAELSDGRLYY